MPADRRVRFGATVGTLISTDVLDLGYVHVDSARGAAYEHDMAGTGVQMYACDDGSIRLCHPTERLWKTYTVRDGE